MAVSKTKQSKEGTKIKKDLLDWLDQRIRHHLMNAESAPMLEIPIPNLPGELRVRDNLDSLRHLRSKYTKIPGLAFYWEPDCPEVLR